MNKIIPTEHAEKSSITDSQTSKLKTWPVPRVLHKQINNLHMNENNHTEHAEKSLINLTPNSLTYKHVKNLLNIIVIMSYW